MGLTLNLFKMTGTPLLGWVRGRKLTIARYVEYLYASKPGIPRRNREEKSSMDVNIR
jgi:hypothetical protein